MSQPEDIEVVPNNSSGAGRAIQIIGGPPLRCLRVRPGTGVRVTPEGSGRISPVLSEISGTTLGTMTQRLPHLGVGSANSESLLSHQMSRRLKVRRKFDALGKVCMRFPVRHGPGVPTLRAASYLRATVPTPPTNTRHVESVPRFS
jgi:hypothetical protein